MRAWIVLLIVSLVVGGVVVAAGTGKLDISALKKILEEQTRMEMLNRSNRLLAALNEYGGPYVLAANRSILVLRAMPFSALASLAVEGVPAGYLENPPTMGVYAWFAFNLTATTNLRLGNSTLPHEAKLRILREKLLPVALKYARVGEEFWIERCYNGYKRLLELIETDRPTIVWALQYYWTAYNIFVDWLPYIVVNYAGPGTVAYLPGIYSPIHTTLQEERERYAKLVYRVVLEVCESNSTALFVNSGWLLQDVDREIGLDNWWWVKSGYRVYVFDLTNDPIYFGDFFRLAGIRGPISVGVFACVNGTLVLVPAYGKEQQALAEVPKTWHGHPVILAHRDPLLLEGKIVAYNETS